MHILYVIGIDGNNIQGSRGTAQSCKRCCCSKFFFAVSPQTQTNRPPMADWRTREEREKYVPPCSVWICLMSTRLSKHLLMWQVDASGALQAEDQWGLLSGLHPVHQPTVSTNIFSISAERHSSPWWPPKVCQASTQRIERCLLLVMVSRDVRYQPIISNFWSSILW